MRRPTVGGPTLKRRWIGSRKGMRVYAVLRADDPFVVSGVWSRASLLLDPN